MKKIFFFALVLTNFSFSQSQAQILTPVHWSYGAKKISPTKAVVFFKAIIDDGWHVYSQTVKNGGPVKTTITFTPSKEYSTIGGTIEPKPLTRKEKVFNMDVSFFEKEVIFMQKIKLRSGTTIVKGTLEYMTCNDRKCLPPEDIEFSIPVK